MFGELHCLAQSLRNRIQPMSLSGSHGTEASREGGQGTRGSLNPVPVTSYSQRKFLVQMVFSVLKPLEMHSEEREWDGDTGFPLEL